MAGQGNPVPNWLKPLWVRLAVVILPAVWAVFELIAGSTLWAALFAAAAAWGLWTLILKFDPDGTMR